MKRPCLVTAMRSVTLLQAGHAANALAQSAKATINCRILPDDDPAMVTQKLTEIAGPKVAVQPLRTSVRAPISEPVAAIMGPGHACRNDRLHVGNRRRVLQRSVVPGTVAHCDDVIVVVDDARNDCALAQVDDSTPGGRPRRSAADGGKAPVADGHRRNDGILRIHRVDAAVDEYELLDCRRLRKHGRDGDREAYSPGETEPKQSCARYTLRRVVSHTAEYTCSRRASGDPRGLTARVEADRHRLLRRSERLAGAAVDRI